MARTQTLVQLSDELVSLLDLEAAKRGVSRSALIREILGEHLHDQREAELDRRMVAGYQRLPQDDARDAWGDLDAWTDGNTRRNRAALAAEEDQPW